ncbi:Guanylate cyclase soluble subunit beta-2 [Phlyctochytrium bullatum]|nr:Guanylate cyclase soluble subunit beta-2 [Phlyctochytrium bullatum]
MSRLKDRDLILHQESTVKPLDATIVVWNTSARQTLADAGLDLAELFAADRGPDHQPATASKGRAAGKGSSHRSGNGAKNVDDGDAAAGSQMSRAAALLGRVMTDRAAGEAAAVFAQLKDHYSDLPIELSKNLSCQVVKVTNAAPPSAAQRNPSHPVAATVRIVPLSASGSRSLEALFTFTGEKGSRRVGAVDEDSPNDEHGSQPGADSSMAASIKSRKLRALLTSLRETRHPCLAPLLFAFAPASTTSPFIGMAYGPVHRGTLVDVFSSLRCPLHKTIKLSLSRDLAAAVSFLNGSTRGQSFSEDSGIVGNGHGPHGMLSPFVCLVDAGWRLKVIAWGGRELAGIAQAEAAGGRRKSDGEGTPAAEEWGLDLSGFSYHGFHSRSEPSGSYHLLFQAPDILAGGTPSEQTDMYSCAMIINYIYTNGDLPFADGSKDPLEMIAFIAKDASDGRVRPKVAQDAPDGVRRIITDGWVARSRLTAEDLFSRLTSIDPKLSSLPIGGSETSLSLLEVYSGHQEDLLGETCSQLQHLFQEDMETLNTKLMECEANRRKAESRAAELQTSLQTERDNHTRAAQRAKDELRRVQEESATELLRLRAMISGLQREILTTRNGLLPKPLSEVIIAQTLAAQSNATVAAQRNGVISQANPTLPISIPQEIPSVDLIFQPTVYDSATMLVASISGFNRFIQQLSTAPRLLLDLLKAYYGALDDAIDQSALARPAIIYPNSINVVASAGDLSGSSLSYQGADGMNSSFYPNLFGEPEDMFGDQRYDGENANAASMQGIRGRVHVVERICDACILVGGAPDRTDSHAEDVIDVGIRLLEWASRWDASHILGANNPRIGIRVGIHSGPVTAELGIICEPQESRQKEKMEVTDFIHRVPLRKLPHGEDLIESARGCYGRSVELPNASNVSLFPCDLWIRLTHPSYFPAVE